MSCQLSLFSIIPIFKCVICDMGIERSISTYKKKKGHVVCSTCLDKMEETKKGANWITSSIEELSIPKDQQSFK